MLRKVLLLAGGILNAVVLLFHAFIGYKIHHLNQVVPPHRAIMEGLNAAVMIAILMFAYASFFHRKELLETGLGRVVLATVSLFYWSRGAEEFFLFKFTPATFALCALIGAIYTALLVAAIKDGCAAQRTSAQAAPFSG